MNISLYFRSHYSKLWKRTFCRSQIKNVILKVYSYQSYYTLFLRNTETQQRISLLSHVQVIDLSLQLFSLLNKKEPQFYCEFLAFYESQYFFFCFIHIEEYTISKEFKLEKQRNGPPCDVFMYSTVHWYILHIVESE